MRQFTGKCGGDRIVRTYEPPCSKLTVNIRNDGKCAVVVFLSTTKTPDDPDKTSIEGAHNGVSTKHPPITAYNVTKLRIWCDGDSDGDKDCDFQFSAEDE